MYPLVRVELEAGGQASGVQGVRVVELSTAPVFVSLGSEQEAKNIKTLGELGVA